MIYFYHRSTRFETERWDSPIEGFVFRIWFWNNSSDTFTHGKSLQEFETPVTLSTPKTPPSTSTQDDGEVVRSYQDPEYTLEDDDLKSQGSPYEWLSNMVPFGHPNLSGRHLLALKQGNVNNRFFFV